jgi:hypothetical protein
MDDIAIAVRTVMDCRLLAAVKAVRDVVARETADEGEEKARNTDRH